MNEKRLRKLNAAQEPPRPVRHGRARPTRRWRSSRGAPRPGIVLEALDAGPAGRPAGEGAGPAAALPGRRGGLPRLLRLGEARPRRRAVAPGTAVSPHPDVRGRAEGRSSRSRGAGRTRSARPRSSIGCAPRRARSSRSASRSARRSKTRNPGFRIQAIRIHANHCSSARRGGLPGEGLQERPQADLVPRVRRLRRRAGDLPRARRHRPAAARDRVRLGHRLLEPHPRLHDGVRLQHGPRPRAADRAGDQARQPRPARARAPAATATASRLAAATWRTPSAATST